MEGTHGGSAAGNPATERCGVKTFTHDRSSTAVSTGDGGAITPVVGLHEPPPSRRASAVQMHSPASTPCRFSRPPIGLGRMIIDPLSTNSMISRCRNCIGISATPRGETNDSLRCAHVTPRGNIERFHRTSADRCAYAPLLSIASASHLQGRELRDILGLTSPLQPSPAIPPRPSPSAEHTANSSWPDSPTPRRSSSRSTPAPPTRMLYTSDGSTHEAITTTYHITYATARQRVPRARKRMVADLHAHHPDISALAA